MKLSIVWNSLTISLALGEYIKDPWRNQSTVQKELPFHETYQEKDHSKKAKFSKDLEYLKHLFVSRIGSEESIAEYYTSASQSWHTRTSPSESIEITSILLSNGDDFEFEPARTSRRDSIIQGAPLNGMNHRYQRDLLGCWKPGLSSTSEIGADSVVLDTMGNDQCRKYSRGPNTHDESDSDTYDFMPHWDAQRRRLERRALQRRMTPTRPMSRSSSAPTLSEQRPERKLNAIGDKTNPRGRVAAIELPLLNRFPASNSKGFRSNASDGSKSQARNNPSTDSKAAIKQPLGLRPLLSNKKGSSHLTENGPDINRPPALLRIKTSVGAEVPKRNSPQGTISRVPEIMPDVSRSPSNEHRATNIDHQSSQRSLSSSSPGGTSKVSSPRQQLPISYPARVYGGSPDSSGLPTPFGSIQGGSVRASIDSPPDSPISSKGSSPSGSPRTNPVPPISEQSTPNQRSPLSSPGRTSRTMSEATSVSRNNGSRSSSPSFGQSGASSSYPTSSTRGSPSYPSSTDIGSSDQLFRPQRSKSFTNVSPKKIELSHQSAPPSRPLPPLERPLTRLGNVAAKIGSPFLWTYNHPAKAGRIGASMTANLASGGAAVAAAYHNVPGALCLAVASATLKFGIDCYDAQDKVKTWHKQEGISPHEDVEATKKVVSALKTAPSKLVPGKVTETVKKIVGKANGKQDAEEPRVLKEEWPIDKLSSTLR